jgi:hypothetical protein
MLLLVLAVAATGCGGKSGDSGTGSSVGMSQRSRGGGDTTAAERSDGGGDTTVKRKPSLQRAFDDARYYLDSGTGSKRGLLQQLGFHVGESYSEAEALYVVNHVDVDWKARAVAEAKKRLGRQGLSKRYLVNALIFSSGFARAEATYAVSRIRRDWNAEAVEAAKETLDSQALSKSQLIARLKRAGFTDAQVRHAVERVSPLREVAE